VDRSSARHLIETTFNQPFDESRFHHFAINLLEGIDEDKAFNWVSGNYVRDAFKDHVKKYRRLGTYTDPERRKLDLLVVHLRKPWALERSRATQRNFVAEYLKQRGEKDAALIAYHVEDPADWRFSFVRMEYREETTADGRIKVKEEFTPSRRYSFLVGRNEPSHTAQQQLVPLLEKIEAPILSDIEQAFGVERVTKEFYSDYRNLFEKVRAALDAIIETDARVHDEFERQTIDPANFAKKLLGQIVFLYFLQKKGWFGVGRDAQGNFKAWGQGPKDFLRRLYEKDCAEYTNCFDEILEPLFYEALATERPDDVYTRFNCRIPFLNGGLFEPLNDYNWREVDVRLPNELVGEILDTFDRYNFTVREDDPLDKEIAVDPEMLGKVFENLLPENLRKGKGSYYTPRNVVHFMCQESVINYLDDVVNRGEVPLAAKSEQQRLIETGEPDQLELRGVGRTVRVPREDIEEFIRRGEFAQEMDLAKAGGPLSYKPEGTKSYSYRVPESIRSRAERIDAALADIKLCDPAVGSGAFLVGMMHEIVKARSILTTYLADVSDRNPYELKRHCIQSSLYGVDIDPGAVDIAKLRLWLSLVVDEEKYKSIHPLPNLDYRVMQGNSLFEDFHGITLSVDDEEEAGTLLRKDAGLVERIGQLHQKQAKYFDAKHPSDKKRLRDAVEDAILAVFAYSIEKQNKAYYDALATIEKDTAKLPQSLRDARKREQLAKLRERFEFDPDELTVELREMTHGNKLRSFFPWRLYFADVFQKKGGFDVVIANPPYVRQELISEQKPSLKAAFPDVYHGVADLYVYFYRRALDIARSSGCVTFISSNKFFRAGYGEKLRAYLRNNTQLKTVIDFGDLPVFEATTYPCVLVISNRPPDDDRSTAQTLNVRNIETIEHLPNAVAREGWPQPQRSLRREGWALERPEVLALLDKLRRSGTSLEEYIAGKFYRGIVTGLNKAFVIDQATRDRLVEEDPRSDEIIKPWLRGQDVKRWRAEWARQYLLWTYKGIAIEKYPVVLEYLSQFREKLAKRWEPSRGQCEWYELRPCDYYAEFEKPKIVWPNLCIEPRFTYDSEEYHVSAPANILPITLANFFLVGIMNSVVISWFMKRTAAERAGNFLEYKPIYVAQLPIPDVSASYRTAIELLVRKLLTAKGQGPQVVEWEQELNALIYELYDLTDEEIRIVEEATK